MTTPIDEIPLPDGVAGRLFATGFSAIGPDAEAALDGVGADTLVCLIRDDEIEARFPDFGVWAASSSRVVRLPIEDFGTPPIEEMAALVGDLVGRIKDGEGVIVHCAAGFGRTSLVCCSILMRLGYGHDDALGHVQKFRLGAGPENADQVDYLATLAGRFVEADG